MEFDKAVKWFIDNIGEMRSAAAQISHINSRAYYSGLSKVFNEIYWRIIRSDWYDKKMKRDVIPNLGLVQTVRKGYDDMYKLMEEITTRYQSTPTEAH